MNEPINNQLKGLLMENLVNYIYGEWSGEDNVTDVRIVEDKTFCETLEPTFYEVEEYGVTNEQARIPHSYGILWANEDINIDLVTEPGSEKNVSIYSKTYVNNTKESIAINETMEQGITVTDTFEFGFTQKINAGYESTISAGVNIGMAEASCSASLHFGVELGASQTITKTKTETNISGFQINFELPPNSRRTVRIVAKELETKCFQSSNFIPKGKAYIRVAYNGEKVDVAHIYIIDMNRVSGSEGTFKYPIDYVFEAKTHKDVRIEISEGENIMQQYAIDK